MNNKKQNHLKNSVLVIIGILILLLIWEISSLVVNKINVFPDAVVTFQRFFQLLGDQSIYLAIISSLGVLLLTLLFSLIVALILGTISGLSNTVNRILTPTITFMKVIPTACIVILLIIFVKSIYSTMIVIFLVVFPILYESIVNGIHNLDQNIINSLRIEGLYSRNSIFKVIIPQILPYLYVGIVSSFGLGMKVEIMSEIIVGSVSFVGLGHLIYTAYAINNDYIQLFALTLLTLFSFGVVDIILYLIKKYFKKFTK